MNKSVSTLDSPEFLNLKPVDISPLMSTCDIKVMYIGQNRNGSCITKEVATEMSKTLRGCPIVGFYDEQKEDFDDHGSRLIYDEEKGFEFTCVTKPYGFVAPDAKVWFQFFEDTDELGNTCVREYLMTTGYLWTEQFPECQSIITSGKGQSMELDEKTLNGQWAKDTNKNLDFFIINDATFSKLCILGDDVEPCFEGASVKASNFSKVKNTLFSMMEDLQKVLIEQKKGDSMSEEVKDIVEETSLKPETTSFKKKEEDDEKEQAPAKDENKGKEPAEEKKDEPVEDDKKSDSDSASDTDKEEDKKKKKTYELLETEYNTLMADYEAVKKEAEEVRANFSRLEEEVKNLREFKMQIEEEKKDKLIESYSMLSDEDKIDVISNKAKYSYDEIEAKLAILCVRNKVNFSEEKVEEDKEPSMTFSLEEPAGSVPAYITALRNNRHNG
jgi:hypothetical protein